MVDAGRAQTWSRSQTIAWIAFRSLAAVRAAAKIERESKTPLWRLVMYAVANDFRQQTTDSPQQAVAVATDAVEQARRSKELLPDKNGKYRVKDVKDAFPSKEGRGKGLARQKTGKWADQIRYLGWYFLTTPKPNGWDWQAHFDWCKARCVATSKKQYQVLRPAALHYAENELASRIRSGVGIMNAQGELSEAEATACKANIRSWKQRGRPRGDGSRIE
jgi:hypothetical protein